MSAKKHIVFKDNNEKQSKFIHAVASGKYSVLLFGGAIRGGKTYVGLFILVMLCRLYPRSRWAVVRQDLKRLKDNTRPSLDKFITGTNVKVSEGRQTFTFTNGSQIIFRGENYAKDKTLEAFKGLEVNGFLAEEVSEIREQTFHKMQERAGSYMIDPPLPQGQPKPLIIMTCNPTQTWVKQMIYDPWKKGELPNHIFYLPSYVTDNKDNLDKEYIESLKNLPIYEYEVFVKGNWDVMLKVKNSFWHAFTIGNHVKGGLYEHDTTIHVSIDANSMPYCSATLWQVFPDDKVVRQVSEIAAEDPDNHGSGLGRLISEKLEKLDYTNVVYMYGDATTKAQNTIDPKKRSFYDLVIEELQKNFHTVDHVGQSNPQVAKTAEFVNAMYAGFDGWSVEIAETCKKSISDYMTVKKDMDGTMLKKRETDEDGNSYEKYGHLSDTKRYFFYRCLEVVYLRWDRRYSGESKWESIGNDHYNDDEY